MAYQRDKGWMHIEAGDHQPDSLLHRRPANVPALIGGALIAGIAYGSIGALLIIVGLLAPSMSGNTERLYEEPPPAEVVFVEFDPARLIKLGAPPDPRALPNRMREARTTAPTAPSKIPRPGQRRVETPDAGPENSIEDLLSRIGTTADEQARIANHAEQEGDPDGVAEGTATAEEGDRYATYLYGLFRRGFNMPSSITTEERRGLRSTVQITTTPSGQIQSYRASPSGNADFDNAVRIRMDQAVGSQLREPPEGERERYFGTTFPVGFRPPR